MRSPIFFLFTILLLVFVLGCSIEDNPSKDETKDYLPVEKEDGPSSPIESKLISEKAVTENIVRKEYKIKNPTSNAWLSVYTYQKDNLESHSPAIILIPGGLHDKKDLIKNGEDSSFAVTLAKEGYVSLIFDADGRGDSEGTEDYNGYITQDGLYEMYRFLSSYDNVDKNKIGIISYSYGIVIASGMLGRYQPHLPFYIEWEGPVNRFFVTVGCEATAGTKATKEGVTCDDEDYWTEREALRFVPYFNVDRLYIVQTEKDHVQPSHRHSLQINNLAIQYLPWVRVNGQENNVNEEYTIDNFPTIPEKDEPTNDEILSYVKEALE